MLGGAQEVEWTVLTATANWWQLGVQPAHLCPPYCVVCVAGTAHVGTDPKQAAFQLQCAHESPRAFSTTENLHWQTSLC